MPEHHYWEVDLLATGPIMLKRPLQFHAPKGFSLRIPFYSDIVIRNAPSGIQATMTSFASTKQIARKATILFFGQVLDVLALKIQQPIYLSLHVNSNIRRDGEFSERRIIQEKDLRFAFQESRLLALSQPTFLRALGWYRKGTYTEDPFDKFLAFWNSIEIVTGKYHPDILEGKPTGSKSQMWESFKKVWGECNQWPVITGDNTWIDKNYNLRNDIAHGLKPIDVGFVEDVMGSIDKIEQLSQRFLQIWRTNELKTEIAPEQIEQYGYPL